MNYAAIFELIAKGLSVAEALIQAGREALPAIKAVQGLVDGSRKGVEITQAQLDEVEITLDQMIDEFNLELPE